MPADRSFVGRNDVERARLHAVVASLSDADLQRSLSNGWTVSAVLAHIAFWDRRALVLLARWERQGVQEAPEDAGAINDAALPEWLALPPRVAADLALAAADAIDEKLATMSDGLLEAILGLKSAINLDRGDANRSEHLDEIEQSLRVK